MADQRKALAAVLRSSQRVQRAEHDLAEARNGLYEAVKRASAADVSLSEIARALKVSRQSVQKMTRR